MAVIMILDRANIRGKKRPKVKAIVCDGYTLYTHGEEKSSFTSNGPVSPLEIAQMMLGDAARPLGEAVYHGLREQLATLAAEEREKARKTKQMEAETERNEGNAGQGTDG